MGKTTEPTKIIVKIIETEPLVIRGPQPKPKLKLKPNRQRYRLLLAAALVIISVDAVVLVRSLQADHRRKIFIAAQTSALGSNNVPSSVKPKPQAVNNYQVPPTQPKYLVIPKLQVKARIIKLSVNPSQQIQAPSNIYDTGWYDASSLPGQPGAMFIDGHVSSWTANGVFYNLKKLRVGDAIQVVRGDNQTFTYVVRQVQAYASGDVDMNQALAPVTAGQPGLNLMTCTGQVISGTSEFNQRLVVYATLQTPA